MNIPSHITRSFIRSNRDRYIFVFGDDRNRNTYMGQAAEAAGEENAYPVTTRLWNCISKATQSYLRDEIYEEGKFLIDQDLNRIRLKIKGDKRLLILFPLIGRGGAEMQVRAPRLLEYLEQQLNLLVKKHNNNTLI